MAENKSKSSTKTSTKTKVNGTKVNSTSTGTGTTQGRKTSGQALQVVDVAVGAVPEAAAP